MYMLEGKRILVTGAAGFIGSNLADALLEKGAEVIGFDNLWNGRMENLEQAQQNKKFTFQKGDVRDYDRLLHLMKDIDMVFHEAAFISVPQSILMPQLCNDVNITGTLNILNAARINDVEKVVFASSAAVYGDEPTLPKHEKMQLNPISPYAVTKQAAEAYMVSYNQVYDLNTTSLRYFNVYGPRQQGSPYSGAIAIFIANIFNEKNITIFGDGSQTRDFTYIKDIIKINLLAAESRESAGKIINVGTGKPKSILEIIKFMIEYSQKEEIEIEYDPIRVGDILHSYGDISLAKEILGYEAEYDALSGFKEYLDYYRKKF
jgi:nucleoside-diphosphate-sugar epimerase